jgi:mRNA-degrading endonuclease RelE of RelBE toxin-antitoxin system
MRFIEFGNYTKQVSELLDPDSYKELQAHLMVNPKSGRFIPGSKYLRKIRWSSKGKGKRGGTRHIYYHHSYVGTFFMLYAYGKSDAENISKSEAKILDQMVETVIKEYRS